MKAEDFERLFEAEAQPLYAFLSYRTGDAALAEDVLADTFERALRARKRLDPGRGTTKSWLYAIALNRLRDLHRRSVAEEAALEGLRSEEDAVDGGFEERVVEGQTLREALMTLPVDEREALALRFGAGLTVPEAARALGQPLSRVEGRVYRGLRRLREELREPAEASEQS